MPISTTDAESPASGTSSPDPHALLEAAPAATYTTDAEGHVRFFNQAAADLAGRRPELGEDDWCMSWRLYHPIGAPMPHHYCPMAITLRENRPLRGIEALAERPDGSRVPFIPLSSPLRDEAGQLIGAVNMLVDISGHKATEAALRASEERYRLFNETLEARVAERTRELSAANERLRAEMAERQRAEAQLLQAQKMEAIGQMASGLAHDFNNLLTAILGNLELIELRVNDETVRKRIEAAKRSALRGASLNEQLLAFSRKQRLVPRPIDLARLIDETVEMLGRTLGGAVEIKTVLPTGLWPAIADPTQFELMLLNLAINARDAMPLGGSVRIRASNIAAGEAASRRDLAPGDYVCIAVSDDGVGMTEAVLARACEPFFTTKGPRKGSGLGLSQVYGVVRQLGGSIELRSEVGKGTTVELFLPRSPATPARDGEASAEGPTAASPPRTALIVDDRADVREVAASQVARSGYHVVEASCSASALATIRDGAAIDLLVSDYAMVKMSGVDLAREARAYRPGLPVIIISGCAETDAYADSLPDIVWLQKPYRYADLAAAVTRANAMRPSKTAFRREPG